MTVDRKLRRKVLLNSFVNTFATHGLDKTSMRYLITESGISSSFIYEMFEGRDQMVIETIRFYYQTLIDANEALRQDANLTFADFLKNIESLAIENLMRDRFVTQAILHPGYRPKVFDLVEQLKANQTEMCMAMAEKEGVDPEMVPLILGYFYSMLNAYIITADEPLFRKQMKSLNNFWINLQQNGEPKPLWKM